MPASSRSPAHRFRAVAKARTFHASVRIGDTIRCLYRISETRVSRSKPNRGIITYGFQILNQRDEVVQEGRR